VLDALLEELARYPAAAVAPPHADERSRFVVPLRLRTDAGVLSFLYTTTLFGTPLDVTLDEIAIESFFPADEATSEALRHIAPADWPVA
jgi:hypothetical protein